MRCNGAARPSGALIAVQAPGTWGSSSLANPERSLDLLFTHFHMDHVFGFPFFVPIYTPGFDVRVTVPAFSEEEARDKLARYLNGVYHPTRLRELPAQVSVSAHAVRTRISLRALRHSLHCPSITRAERLGLPHARPGGRSGRLHHRYGTLCRPRERGLRAGQEHAVKAEARGILEFLRGCTHGDL